MRLSFDPVKNKQTALVESDSLVALEAFFVSLGEVEAAATVPWAVEGNGFEGQFAANLAAAVEIVFHISLFAQFHPVPLIQLANRIVRRKIAPLHFLAFAQFVGDNAQLFGIALHLATFGWIAIEHQQPADSLDFVRNPFEICSAVAAEGFDLNDV